MLGNLQQPGAGGGSGGGRQPSVPPHVVSPAFVDGRTLVETKLARALTIQDTASSQSRPLITLIISYAGGSCDILAFQF